MRDIKFRYWWQYESSFILKVFTINEIEHRNVIEFVCSDEFRPYPITSGKDQFTGLTDKNGIEIYESDIVQWIDGDKNTDSGVIEWDKTYAGFGITGEHCLDWSHMLTVIGNIHQSPELLSK